MSGWTEINSDEEQPAAVAGLELLLRQRIGWADEIISPFARRARRRRCRKQRLDPEIDRAA